MKDQDQLLDLQTTDSFRLYLDEVGRHPLLTKEDEIELSQAGLIGLGQLNLVLLGKQRVPTDLIQIKTERVRRLEVEQLVLVLHRTPCDSTHIVGGTYVTYSFANNHVRKTYSRLPGVLGRKCIRGEWAEAGSASTPPTATISRRSPEGGPFPPRSRR